MGETTRLQLVSADVAHSFWVPAFLTKRDLIPGVDNQIDVHPTEIGRYPGRCAEFCGLDHARMDFSVRVVSQGRLPAMGRAGPGGQRLMTLTTERPTTPSHPERPRATGLLGWLTSTDHKQVGISYMVTAFGFFMIGGALAEVIRAQLWSPDSHLVSASTYDQVFTMHGSIMMYLFIVPFAFGLANYLVPLQIGADEVAFPRLNALGYWIYLFGGLTMLSGFLTADGAADFGWTAYVPLSSGVHSPSVGADLWLVAIILTGLAGVLASVNIVATVLMMRAPGMSMFRMPIFTWNMLVTSILVLIAFPVLTSASCMLLADRLLGCPHLRRGRRRGRRSCGSTCSGSSGTRRSTSPRSPTSGWSPRSSRCSPAGPCSATSGSCSPRSSSPRYSVGVWAHHMFATGAVEVTFFSGLSFLIAVPTGVKFFNWIGTMWGGSIVFDTPMLFAVGFLGLFLLGGLTGVLLASVPVDLQLTDSYFVVAHMHYVLFGGSAFALFAAIYYWYPKFTGTRLDERLGKVHFWLMFVGFNLTFAVQHQLGLDGMPRRIATYRADRRVHHPQPDLHRGGRAARGVDLPVPVERVPDLAQGRARRRRPVGRPHARVGDHLASPAAQLRRPAPDPLQPPGVGPPPPRPPLAEPPWLTAGPRPSDDRALDRAGPHVRGPRRCSSSPCRSATGSGPASTPGPPSCCSAAGSPALWRVPRLAAPGARLRSRRRRRRTGRAVVPRRQHLALRGRRRASPSSPTACCWACGSCCQRPRCWPRRSAGSRPRAGAAADWRVTPRPASGSSGSRAASSRHSR